MGRVTALCEQNHKSGIEFIAAFVRGSTNPPPEQWFVKAETWNKQVRKEGIVVTVPGEAQQALPIPSRSS